MARDRTLATARGLAVLAALLACLAPCTARARGPRLPIELPTSAQAEKCVAARAKARDAIAKDDWTIAARHLRAATEAFPGSQTDWYDLACVLAKRGDVEAALEALRRASDLGRLTVARVASDADLDRLHGLPAYDEILKSCSATRVRADEAQATEDLATSREEIDLLATKTEERLAGVQDALGMQFTLGLACVARWKAASLDAMASRATDPGERDRLRWEALRALLTEDIRPAFESLGNDVVGRASPETFTGSAHQVEAAQARATARFMLTVLDSADEDGRGTAVARLRSDLLDLAACSTDQPALERVLTILLELTVDDLPLSVGLHRRLMAMSADRAAARERAQLSSPGTVLAAEGIPAFRATTTSGATFSNATLANRLTLVDVWATWCHFCVVDLPQVQAIHSDFGSRGLDVIGVAAEVEPEREAFLKWCAEHDVTWPQVLDTAPEPERIVDKLAIASAPCYLLIDSNGRVIAAAARAEPMRRAIERALPSADVSGVPETAERPRRSAPGNE